MGATVKPPPHPRAYGRRGSHADRPLWRSGAVVPVDRGHPVADIVTPGRDRPIRGLPRSSLSAMDAGDCWVASRSVRKGRCRCRAAVSRSVSRWNMLKPTLSKPTRENRSITRGLESAEARSCGLTPTVNVQAARARFAEAVAAFLRRRRRAVKPRPAMPPMASVTIVDGSGTGLTEVTVPTLFAPPPA